MGAHSRAGFALLALVVLVTDTRAATQKEIDEAVRKGTAYLSQRYEKMPNDAGHGIGPAALAGLALLESGGRPDDPALKTITAAVRDAAYAETRTYQITLCLLFLDRLNDPNDLPLIQLLGVRLLAGQNANGGWTYSCVSTVSDTELRHLRTKLNQNQLVAGGGTMRFTPEKPAPKTAPGKAPEIVGRLHPEVEKVRQGYLSSSRPLHDDNSNTQFGVLGVWAARKHGVPVEHALELIERRFLVTQNPQTGGWPYSGRGSGSASMTCAGLLGLATSVARREEQRLVAQGKKPAPKKAEPPTTPKSDDPFFNPPPRPAPAQAAVPKPQPKDNRDVAVQLAFANLARVLESQPQQARRGQQALDNIGSTGRDLYFLWSLERVCVVYGVNKIKGIDWYEFGANALIPSQRQDGSWAGQSHGPDVDTSFALLFLARSNLVRDLSAKVRGSSENELRSGGPELPAFDPVPAGSPTPAVASDAAPPSLPPPLPKAAPATLAPSATVPKNTESAQAPKNAEPVSNLAGELLFATGKDWEKTLERLRDTKGAEYTQALTEAVAKLDGNRKKQVREALASRLTRMTANTLREMLKSDDAELRRAAALACAMKDDKDHIPDLIDRLTDSNAAVSQAARAGVKSLTGSKIDFGPELGSTAAQQKTAADAWRSWWASQKP